MKVTLQLLDIETKMSLLSEALQIAEARGIGDDSSLGQMMVEV
jgi:hypothetical protein